MVVQEQAIGLMEGLQIVVVQEQFMAIKKMLLIYLVLLTTCSDFCRL